MSLDTQYEIYEIRGGQWSLADRFSSADATAARERASEHFDANNYPCLLIEESDSGDGERTISAVWSSSGVLGKARPPVGTDLMSRFFLVGIGGLATGILGAILAAAMMASARGKVIGGVVLLAFLGFAFAGMLILFKFAVPTEMLLWRNKPEAIRKKIVQTLMFGASGTDEADSRPQRQPPGAAGPLQALRRRRQAATPNAEPATESMALNAEGSGQAGSLFDAPDGTAEPTAAEATAILDDFIRKESAKLEAFTDDAWTSVLAEIGDMNAFQRFGFNLYIAGANQELVSSDALTPKTARQVLANALVRTGCSAESADAFCGALDTYPYRPRYQRMLDAGKNAMASKIDDLPVAPNDIAHTAVANWNTASDNSAPPQRFVVMITEALDAKAALEEEIRRPSSRLMRVHNSAVRTALKSASGTEVQHTGSGILAIFPDPIAAVAAATEIQQEIAAYVRSAQDAPLAIRIGLHSGEVTLEEGEYLGDALSAVAQICQAGDVGDIVCSEWTRDRTAGSVYRYETLGDAETLLDAGKLFRLVWEPKRSYGRGAVEYRNIGTKPKAGDDT